MEYKAENCQSLPNNQLNASDLMYILKRTIKDLDREVSKKPHSMDGTFPVDSVAMAKFFYNMRRFREKVFTQKDIFSDPAWDILLDLYISKAKNKKISVTSACLGSAVPPTTALRWLKILEDRSLIIREVDHEDGRRNFISISALGCDLMERSLNFR